MRSVEFRFFPEDEKEDFAQSCARWRKNPDEFAVRAEEQEPGSAPSPLRREVIVTHTPTGKARRYEAGSGSNWNASFEDDLQALFFSGA
jgi:hypothetical protein